VGGGVDAREGGREGRVRGHGGELGLELLDINDGALQDFELVQALLVAVAVLLAAPLPAALLSTRHLGLALLPALWHDRTERRH